MTYPLSFRQKVLLFQKKHGLTFQQTADHLKVCIASITSWAKQPEPQKTRNKPATRIDMEALA